MAELDDKPANWQLSENLDHDRDSFSISDHWTVSAGDVEIALVELPPPSALGLRLVATVHVQDVTICHGTTRWDLHSRYVVTLDVAAVARGNKARKGHLNHLRYNRKSALKSRREQHSEVVAQGQQLSSLIGKIVNQLGVFAIPAIICH